MTTTTTTYHDATIDGHRRVTVVDWPTTADGFQGGRFGARIPKPADLDNWKRYDAGAHGDGVTFETLSPDGD